MEKLLKAKKIKTMALIASAVLGVAALCGMALFSLKLLYAPLIVCIVVAVYAVYSVPLYAISLYDARLCARVIAEWENGTETADEISLRVGIKPEAVSKIIDKCIRLGYITNNLA